VKNRTGVQTLGLNVTRLNLQVANVKQPVLFDPKPNPILQGSFPTFFMNSFLVGKYSVKH